MQPEVIMVWQALQTGDYTPALLIQLSVIAAALLLAWSINGTLRAYVMRRATER